ncbi:MULTISPECIES: universal stress protein [Mycobacteroides]|uniref:Universal stress protein n=1 Tax=Mycobacteroides chelonae TaxID=1774 RepID=A0A1S1LPN5_MYCCH|nr:MULTISPECIES: universal stress protein [Mycobacteroides]KRQ25430.1 universal stress protein [Mycobacteroides sp. H003]KRQ31888.1 universal stress protein [Mycobacteroides sp. H092]KRQ34904.1 universal stress protein [Mycobacteroides sp. H101]KRQ53291.1 universal stress protein [Mycobacteroides sp. H063]KRQ60385.1 universal stress protein [Mycobacteroides sp. H079]
MSSSNNAAIIVGVDGSPSSDAAVRWAAQESAMYRVPVHLVSAFDIERTHVHEQQRRERIYQSRERQAQLALERAQRIVNAVSNNAVHCHVAFGHPVQVLMEAARDARILVVGCRGLRPMDRLLLGSVSTALLHHAPCPVAVVHQEAAPDKSLPVLLGIDGSPASERATAIAFAEASHRKVPLVAVHAWHDWNVVGPEIDLDVTVNEEKQTLAERLAGWQERYPDVTVERRVVCDLARHYLVEESAHTQLVVVGSHGRGGFTGMMLGSVASAVAQASRVPVVVARPS